MRRVLTGLLLVTLGTALHTGAGAAAQGRIEGDVINEATGRPQSGVEVTLSTGSSTEATQIVDTVITDERGRFRFDDLETGEARFYAIDGTYDGGLFSGGAITIPDDTGGEEPVIESTLRVWDTTTDPNAILITRNSLFLNPREGTLAVVESVTIANTSDRAYIGRGGREEEGAEPEEEGAEPEEEGAEPEEEGAEPEEEGRDDEGGARTSIGFALPTRADETSIAIVDADINIPELVPTDFGFGATVAIPPGETRVTFSYSLRGVAAAYDLSRTALYPTARMSVYAVDPLDVSSNRLTEGAEVQVGEQTYREYSTESGLEAGDAFQVVAIADAGTPRSLLLGMLGVLALVVALGLYPFLRRGRKETAAAPVLDERDALLHAIAELDVKRDRGEVDEEHWATERAELKARLLDDGAANGTQGTKAAVKTEEAE